MIECPKHFKITSGHESFDKKCSKVENIEILFSMVQTRGEVEREVVVEDIRIA